MIVHHWDYPLSSVRSFLRSILTMPFETTFRVYHTSFDDRVDTAVLVATQRVNVGDTSTYRALVALGDAVDKEMARMEAAARD